MTKSSLLNKINTVIHICTFMLIMGVGIPQWRAMSGYSLNLIEGDSLQRNLLLVGYALTILPLLLNLDKAVTLLIKNPSITAILMLSVFSIIVSNYPDLSSRRVLALILTVLFSFSIYLQYPDFSLIKLLGVVFLIITILNVLMIIFLPDWGIMKGYHEGAWCGIFTHKNTLGNYSVIALIIFQTLVKSAKSKKLRIFWGAFTIVCVLMVIKSESMTAYICTGMVFATRLFLGLAHSMRKSLVVILLFGLIALGSGLLIVFSQYENIVEMIGRDASLTGRIPLWKAVLEFGNGGFFGFGYKSFWVGDKYPSGEIHKLINWPALHAHNGFIDVWLEIGWIGLVISTFQVFYYMSRHFKIALKGHNEQEFWFVFLIIFILHNLVTSNLWSHNDIYTVLFVFSMLAGKSIVHKKIADKHDQAVESST